MDQIDDIASELERVAERCRTGARDVELALRAAELGWVYTAIQSTRHKPLVTRMSLRAARSVESQKAIRSSVPASPAALLVGSDVGVPRSGAPSASELKPRRIRFATEGNSKLRDANQSATPLNSTQVSTKPGAWVTNSLRRVPTVTPPPTQLLERFHALLADPMHPMVKAACAAKETVEFARRTVLEKLAVVAERTNDKKLKSSYDIASSLANPSNDLTTHLWNAILEHGMSDGKQPNGDSNAYLNAFDLASPIISGVGVGCLALPGLDETLNAAAQRLRATFAMDRALRQELGRDHAGGVNQAYFASVTHQRGTMSIKEDAGRIMHAIANFAEAPDDKNVGRHNLTGQGIRSALKEQQDFDASSERINDAVELLKSNGYVKVKRSTGTAPYSFYGVELTPAGRLEYENMKERSSSSGKSEQPKTSVADTKKVFVIHGRDERRRKAIFDFLRSIGLQPIEWSQARSMTGKASPYIGEILEAAFGRAQAVVALMTGDDEAHLRSELLSPGEKEEPLTPQARPNVLFEAGMAMGSHEDRTVFVEVGPLRPFSDVAGRHAVRIDQNPQTGTKARQDLATRLKDAGCDVDISGTDWHTAGDFW